MNYEALRELFVTELQDLYSAEQQITRCLPRFFKAAHNPKLKQALQQHHEETALHVERLARILLRMKEVPNDKSCHVMHVLLHEVEERVRDGGDAEIMDAGIIAAMQRVEHYEIAAYSSARTYAEQLGESDSARFLSETLDEEMRADLRLSQLAHRVNVVRRAA
jgi:ferritin-like metal-binding protein YciE